MGVAGLGGKGFDRNTVLVPTVYGLRCFGVCVSEEVTNGLKGFEDPNLTAV